MPTAAQTEGVAVLDDGFVVVAASGQGQFLFHRSRDGAEWTTTELVDVPVFSFDLLAHDGRSYGASLSGIWEWDEDRAN